MDSHMLGEPLQYWVELDRRVKEGKNIQEVKSMIREIAELRGKLSFVQSRIAAMKEVLDA